MSNEHALADGERIARLFHDTYERFAPDFGYETRDDTKAFDPATPNGRLMIAVCSEVVAALSAPGFAAGDIQPSDDVVERVTRAIEGVRIEGGARRIHDFCTDEEITELARAAIAALEQRND